MSLHSFLRIGGERVADLDFSGMFPRLAALEIGEDIGQRDPYAVPGFEAHRAGIKRTVAAFFWDPDGRRTKLPKGVRELLPPGTTFRVVNAAIRAHLRELEAAFGFGIGGRLQWREGMIIIAAIEELMSQGIVGLNMFDGLMVPASRVLEAARAMGDASERIVGARLPVTVADAA
ncbi:hypothetical protein BH10PSE7_BH10PSE7_42530 [soil metagenome]